MPPLGLGTTGSYSAVCDRMRQASRFVVVTYSLSLRERRPRISDGGHRSPLDYTATGPSCEPAPSELAAPSLLPVIILRSPDNRLTASVSAAPSDAPDGLEGTTVRPLGAPCNSVGSLLTEPSMLSREFMQAAFGSFACMLCSIDALRLEGCCSLAGCCSVGACGTVDCRARLPMLTCRGPPNIVCLVVCRVPSGVGSLSSRSACGDELEATLAAAPAQCNTHGRLVYRLSHSRVLRAYDGAIDGSAFASKRSVAESRAEYLARFWKRRPAPQRETHRSACQHK
jgi:hypothetical protein